MPSAPVVPDFAGNRRVKDINVCNPGMWFYVSYIRDGSDGLFVREPPRDYAFEADPAELTLEAIECLHDMLLRACRGVASRGGHDFIENHGLLLRRRSPARQSPKK